jgi:LmbE family N-acetylglucosaminyl deacetylase
MVNYTMNVLAFFAHPDDETMLTGGTLALLAHTGARVHYLCATRGEGGEIGEPPVCTLDELRDVRVREMRCAVETLSGKSLTFLDYVDPRVGPENEMYAYTHDINTLAKSVAEIITQVKADVMLAHGSNGEYGHPSHVLSHQAAREAIARLGESAPNLYSVSASFPGHPKPRLRNRDDPAELILDVTPVMGIKTKAALCHRTQHALFVRRSSASAGRQMSVTEVLVSVESLHRVRPPYKEPDADTLYERLEPWSIKK